MDLKIINSNRANEELLFVLAKILTNLRDGEEKLKDEQQWKNFTLSLVPIWELEKVCYNILEY